LGRDSSGWNISPFALYPESNTMHQHLEGGGGRGGVFLSCCFCGPEQQHVDAAPAGAAGDGAPGANCSPCKPMLPPTRLLHCCCCCTYGSLLLHGGAWDRQLFAAYRRCRICGAHYHLPIRMINLILILLMHATLFPINSFS
jgi:hypothetical protein